MRDLPSLLRILALALLVWLGGASAGCFVAQHLPAAPVPFPRVVVPSKPPVGHWWMPWAGGPCEIILCADGFCATRTWSGRIGEGNPGEPSIWYVGEWQLAGETVQVRELPLERYGDPDAVRSTWSVPRVLLVCSWQQVK